jgi:hypothetical protein
MEVDSGFSGLEWMCLDVFIRVSVYLTKERKSNGFMWYKDIQVNASDDDVIDEHGITEVLDRTA